MKPASLARIALFLSAALILIPVPKPILVTLLTMPSAARFGPRHHQVGTPYPGTKPDPMSPLS
jgi:hypothetical protein